MICEPNELRQKAESFFQFFIFKRKELLQLCDKLLLFLVLGKDFSLQILGIDFDFDFVLDLLFENSFEPFFVDDFDRCFLVLFFFFDELLFLG